VPSVTDLADPEVTPGRSDRKYPFSLIANGA